eukprot:1161667-Pelagomonas_calceolata.AAC.5
MATAEADDQRADGAEADGAGDRLPLPLPGVHILVTAHAAGWVGTGVGTGDLVPSQVLAFEQ